jgi:alpha,alpha-trehalase
VIFDLDGVVTRTARLHAQAWKLIFDEFLHRQAAGDLFEPFDIDTDYAVYVDGKPRYAGVRSFLESRGISLPEGTANEPPGSETICAIGNRKNQVFNELLAAGGVQVFEDTVDCIREWRGMGLATAIVSSSKNCGMVLRSAGLEELFDVRVDGLDIERLNFNGKPHPDMFLRAAELLGVDAARSVVVEDAVSGVQAGRAGGFGLVVGVDRDGAREVLLENGADVVVSDLRELRSRDDEC